MRADLSMVRRFPNTCDAGVTRAEITAKRLTQDTLFGGTA